jgi:hypothetical protein
MADSDTGLKIVIEADASQASAELGKLNTAIGGVSGAQKESTRAGLEGVSASGKSLSATRQLTAAFRGLGLEFPLLGRLGRLAMNPITLAVLSITSAFRIWHERVRATADALSGLELPELSKLDPGRIHAAAEAWKQYSEALDSVVEKYNAVPAAADRAIAAINAQAAREKKLVEARKELELAQAKTPGERLAIMDRYGAIGVSAEAGTRKQTIAAQYAEKFNLELDARKKLAQAAGIKVAGAGTDTANEADLKAQADTASQNIAKAKAAIKDILDAENNGVISTLTSLEGLKSVVRNFFSHGLATDEASLGVEREKIARNKPAVDRLNRFLGAKGGRAELRDRRGRLLGEAGEALGRAGVIGAEIGTAEGELGRDTAANRGVAGMQSLTRTAAALSAADKDRTELADQMAKYAESGRAATADLVARYKALNAEMDTLRQQMAARSTGGAFN